MIVISVFKGLSACGAGGQDVRAPFRNLAIPFLSQEILANRREDVYQNHFLVKHRRSVPRARRKVKHITRRSDALFVANGEEHPAPLDDCHLFVWMIMRGSYDVRPNSQAADHQFFTDNHLSLNARF
jgi:hypothetical protein